MDNVNNNSHVLRAQNKLMEKLLKKSLEKVSFLANNIESI